MLRHIILRVEYGFSQTSTRRRMERPGIRIVVLGLLFAAQGIALIACRDLTGPSYHGDAISYVSLDANAQRLVVITPDGRTLATYPLPAAPFYAQLSPDHTMIALNDISSKLWVANVRDHSNRAILGPSQAAGSVDWSADGQQLLFDNDYSHDEAWIVNADGSAAHAVAHVWVAQRGRPMEANLPSSGRLRVLRVLSRSGSSMWTALEHANSRSPALRKCRVGATMERRSRTRILISSPSTLRAVE